MQAQVCVRHIYLHQQAVVCISLTEAAIGLRIQRQALLQSTYSWSINLGSHAATTNHVFDYHRGQTVSSQSGGIEHQSGSYSYSTYESTDSSGWRYHTVTFAKPFSCATPTVYASASAAGAYATTVAFKSVTSTSVIIYSRVPNGYSDTIRWYAYCEGT